MRLQWGHLTDGFTRENKHNPRPQPPIAEFLSSSLTLPESPPSPQDSQPPNSAYGTPTRKPRPVPRPRPQALGPALTPGAVGPPAQVRLSDFHGDFWFATRRGRRRDAARGPGRPLDSCIFPRPGLALPHNSRSRCSNCGCRSLCRHCGTGSDGGCRRDGRF